MNFKIIIVLTFILLLTVLIIVSVRRQHKRNKEMMRWYHDMEERFKKVPDKETILKYIDELERFSKTLPHSCYYPLKHYLLGILKGRATLLK